MKKATSIFVISMIATVVSGPVRADVASAGFVREMLDGAEVSANKETSISDYDVQDANKYPNMPVAQQMILDSQSSIQGQLKTESNARKAEDEKLQTALNAVKSTADTAVQPGALAAVATSGSYNDLTNKPTIPAAQVQADWNATTGVAAIKNKPTIPTKVSQLTNDSGFATTTAVNAKVSTAQGDTNKNKAVITDASGNITTGTVSSAMIADGTIVNADIASNAAIAASKISGLAAVATTGSYNDLANKPTIPPAITVDSALSATSTNPVQNKVVNTALSGKQATLSPAQLNAANSGITSAKVATYDGYAQQIAGKQAALGYTAENSANKTTTIAAAASASDTKYPSEKAVAAALSGKLATTGTAARATADASGNNIASTYATKAQLNNLDATATGTGAVIVNVSQTDGKITATKGNVRIPVGSATGTTYATIWVQ